MTETDNDTKAKLILKWFWNHALTGWVLAAGLAAGLVLTLSELHKASGYKPELDRTRTALALATRMLDQKGGGK